MDMNPNHGSLFYCRACLSTDVRLFSIHQNKLTDAFSCIIGTPVLQDKLSQYLCAYCCTMLLKCRSFRDMCIRAQKLLSQLVDGELHTDSISTMNDPPHQFYNLKTTKVEIVDYTLLEDIKLEPNIDIISIDTIMENRELKVEFENKKDEFKITDDTGQDITALKEDKDIKRRKRKIGTGRKKVDIEIEYDNNDVDLSSEDDEKCHVKKKKIKEKNVVKKDKVNLKNDDLSKEVKKVKRKRKNKVSKTSGALVADLVALESEYTVQIVNLSKEEQLEEIASRKKSRNYLESRFRCEGCGKGYDADSAYNNHLLRHSPSAGALVCEVCSLRFKVRCRLLKHQESHQLKFICKFDGCSFVSRDRAHAKNHHAMHAGKTFECQHCGKSFKKSTTYLTHVRLSHPAMNVACNICGETFVSQKGCRLHKNRMHPENTKPQKHSCSICAATFISAEALRRHAEEGEGGGCAGEGGHQALRPCEQCGHNCASEGELLQHVADVHPSETRRCEECNITFPSAASFDTHHRRKHLNQQSRRQRHVARKKYVDKPREKRQLVCEQCGRTKPSRRQRHVARKKYVDKPREKRQLVCEQCGRTKPNAALLRYHQRIHDGVKPFACERCPKAFTLKSALVWHTRTHTGEKPHQCAECPRAFSSKANYNRHHRTVHLGIRGQFPCSACARVFSTRSDARVHADAVHRGLRAPRPHRRRHHHHHHQHQHHPTDNTNNK